MTVLAVGAHPDDIELGCGGALLAHRRAGEAVWMLVMTAGTNGGSGALRRREQTIVARRLEAELLWGDFVDGDIPATKDAISVIDEALALSGADVLYTHAPDDAHQDHRNVATASIAAGRKIANVLGYETPSTQRFAPTVFVALHDLVPAKVELVAAHNSQIDRRSRVDLDVVAAQARVRGHQARLGNAEGFEVVRAQFVPGAGLGRMSAHAAAVPSYASHGTE